MKRDLLYQPNLEYEKKYYTEGTFEDQTKESTNEPENVSIDTIKSIQLLQEEIDNNIKWLPNVIKDTYLSPYIVMKDEFNKISDMNYEEDSPIPEAKVIEEETIDDDIPEDIFDKGTDIYIDIKDPLADKSDVINNRYYIDFVDIYKDYLNKLNMSTQKYIYNNLSMFNNIDSNQELLNDYSTTSIKNKNLSHVSDYLVKSDISLDQSLRLHDKLFDFDSIILHVRGIRLAAKYIERYYKEEKLEENNDLATTSNILLTETKKVAEKKYKENFYSLYKYLNSSVILMDESTKTLLKQNKGMMIINKYEEREQDDTTTNQ